MKIKKKITIIASLTLVIILTLIIAIVMSVQTYNVSTDALSDRITFSDRTPKQNSVVQSPVYIDADLPSGDTNQSAYINFDNSLLAYMDYDAPVNGVYRDYSDYNHSTNIKYKVTQTEGIFGKAIRSDRLGGIYINDLNISKNPTLTVDTWINLEKDAKTEGKFNYFFSGLYQHNANNYFYIEGTNDYFEVKNFPLKKWNHIVFTLSGDTSTSKLYINGLQQKLVIQRSADDVVIAKPFVVGRSFTGSIDETRIWNRVLQDQEILASENSRLHSLSVVFNSLTKSSKHEFQAVAINSNGFKTKSDRVKFTVGTISAPTSTSTPKPTNTITPTPTATPLVDSNKILSTIVGDDWTLPNTKSKSKYSGLYWTDPYYIDKYSDNLSDIHYGMMIRVDWELVNPSEGKYDWSSVDSELAKLEKYGSGAGFTLWPRYNKKSHIPTWVQNKYTIIYNDKGGVAAWREGSQFNQAVKPMITEMAKRYGNNPRLISVEMRSPFDSGAGEWSYRSSTQMYNEIWHDPNFLPSFCSWGKEFFDMYSNSFPNSVHKKLVNVISTPWWGAPCADELTTYTLSKGMGQRDGSPNGILYPLGIGVKVQDDGYLVYDESHPIYTNQAFSGTEAEEYNDAHTWVPLEYEDYLFKYNVLTSLQARRNWFCTSTYVLKNSKFQPILNWTQLELGQTAKTSQDGWSWLTESNYPPYHLINSKIPTGTVKNNERWIYQRDVGTDGITQPTYKQPYSMFQQSWSAKFRSFYGARKTNMSVNSNKIYFSADPEFLNGTKNVQIKITYLDTYGITFRLEYGGQKGISSTNQIKGSGTNKWKTVTIEVSNMKFGSNPFKQSNMDFRIVADGNRDVSVSFVRVIKN